MKVAVIGLGYVGVPLAAVLASNGVRVVGIDIDGRKVTAIGAGKNPLRGKEPGLAELIAAGVAAGRLSATTDYTAVDGADAAVVGVETPIDDDTHDPDYRAMRTALRSLAPHLRKGVLVSIESTVAPGTMAGVVRPVLERGSGLKAGRDFHLVHCPERVTAGKLLHNLTTLDRVIGAADERGGKNEMPLTGESHPTQSPLPALLQRLGDHRVGVLCGQTVRHQIQGPSAE